jgi:hypothetical protein
MVVRLTGHVGMQDQVELEFVGSDAIPVRESPERN